MAAIGLLGAPTTCLSDFVSCFPNRTNHQRSLASWVGPTAAKVAVVAPKAELEVQVC